MSSTSGALPQSTMDSIRILAVKPFEDIPPLVLYSIIVSIALLIIAFSIMIVRSCIEAGHEDKFDDNTDLWSTTTGENCNLVDEVISKREKIEGSSNTNFKTTLRRSSSSPISHRAALLYTTGSPVDYGSLRKRENSDRSLLSAVSPASDFA